MGNIPVLKPQEVLRLLERMGRLRRGPPKRLAHPVEARRWSCNFGSYAAAFQVGLIDEALCLELNKSVKDRNLTSHTYHEGLAEKICQNLPNYAKAFDQLLSHVEQLIQR
jgi:hypothetical protein